VDGKNQATRHRLGGPRAGRPLRFPLWGARLAPL